MRRREFSRREGREVALRLQETRRRGGTSHEAVKAQVLSDLDRELRRLVRGYRGLARQAREILEGLVIAREAGLDCTEIEDQLAARVRKRRRAA